MLVMIPDAVSTPPNFSVSTITGNMSSPGASSSRSALHDNKKSADNRFAEQFSDGEVEMEDEYASENGGDEEESDAQPHIEPLSAEALAEFEAKQARTGIVYISRIPPAMRPSKVRHLMSGFGTIGRVYLQQEGMLDSPSRRSPSILTAHAM